MNFDRLVTVKGTVTQFVWANPHPMMSLRFRTMTAGRRNGWPVRAHVIGRGAMAGHLSGDTASAAPHLDCSAEFSLHDDAYEPLTRRAGADSPGFTPTNSCMEIDVAGSFRYTRSHGAAFRGNVAGPRNCA